jgi:hypothetical protein
MQGRDEGERDTERPTAATAGGLRGDPFAGLDAARHLYEKFGFTLIEQQLGRQ